VRLIDATGINIGVVTIDKAQSMAEDAELDLVEIVPNAKPPVCRVMDYGKFKFEQNKKAQIARKKQKQVQVKEIKFRPGTEEGDYRVKMRKLVEFLQDGDKAKVTIRFRGREMMHQSRGAQLLNRVEADLDEYALVEQRPRMEGRQMVMVFAPRKT
jgi:translation initiation factor IF-3